MNDTLYYLCFTTDNGEVDLVSSHATREEAWKEWHAQSSTMTDFSRYSIKCIAELGRDVRDYTSLQDELRHRISQKQQERQAVRQVRAILRSVRDTLPEVAYRPLTDKFIELTDIIDKGERYIENRSREVERYAYHVERCIKDGALLRAAINSAKAANGKAIHILDKRSLAQTHNIRGDDNSRETEDSE